MCVFNIETDGMQVLESSDRQLVATYFPVGLWETMGTSDLFSPGAIEKRHTRSSILQPRFEIEAKEREIEEEIAEEHEKHAHKRHNITTDDDDDNDKSE